MRSHPRRAFASTEQVDQDGRRSKRIPSSAGENSSFALLLETYVTRHILPIHSSICKFSEAHDVQYAAITAAKGFLQLKSFPCTALRWINKAALSICRFWTLHTARHIESQCRFVCLSALHRTGTLRPDHQRHAEKRQSHKVFFFLVMQDTHASSIDGFLLRFSTTRSRWIERGRR